MREKVLENNRHSHAGRGKDLTRQNENVGRKGGQTEARKRGFMQARWNLAGRGQKCACWMEWPRALTPCFLGGAQGKTDEHVGGKEMKTRNRESSFRAVGIDGKERWP